MRDDESVETIRFDDLGYAQAAVASYAAFARRKREGSIPAHCRFQVSLPTPLAPIAAFVAAEDQSRIEPLYEARIRHELTTIFDAIPHDQLAIQWDTNFEFAMLDGVMPAWFDDPRASIVERLVRLGRSIPAGVHLGYHFCHGHERHHRERPYDAQPLVDIANALSLSLGRSLDWVHLPVEGGRVDLRFFETLGGLALRPETRLYLGLIHPADGLVGARARVVAAQRFVHDFGVATDCGWSRHRPQDLEPLIELHRDLTTPIETTSRRRAAFRWPAGWARIPDESWTAEPVDAFGASYDNVDRHSWYRNLDPTVEELAHLLTDGDILVDYSGGTGILVDRLKSRMFGTAAGAVIVDSSPKFLRVALEKFGDDPAVGFRLLRYLQDDKRLQHLDEVLGASLVERGVDVIVSTNAVHLYPDLADTVSSWLRALRPGGHVLINSGNIRNPRARRSEWILDETVWVVGDLAEGLVRTDSGLRRVPSRARRHRADEGPRRVPRPRVPPSPTAGALPRDAGARRAQGRVGPRGQHRGARRRLVRAALDVPRRRARLGRRDREGRRDGAVAGSRDRPSGADPPGHGRPVPRPADVPGVLDVRHLRVRVTDKMAG